LCGIHSMGCFGPVTLFLLYFTLFLPYLHTILLYFTLLVVNALFARHTGLTPLCRFFACFCLFSLFFTVFAAFLLYVAMLLLKCGCMRLYAAICDSIGMFYILRLEVKLYSFLKNICFLRNRPNIQHKLRGN
jgi:hypothetical protein